MTEVCPVCDGDGYGSGAFYVVNCPRCGGRGKVETVTDLDADCLTCNDTGYVCSNCGEAEDSCDCEDGLDSVECPDCEDDELWSD